MAATRCEENHWFRLAGSLSSLIDSKRSLVFRTPLKRAPSSGCLEFRAHSPAAFQSTELLSSEHHGWYDIRSENPFDSHSWEVETSKRPVGRPAGFQNSFSPPHVVVATLKPLHLVVLSQVLEKTGNSLTVEIVPAGPNLSSTASGCGRSAGGCRSPTPCG